MRDVEQQKGTNKHGFATARLLLRNLRQRDSAVSRGEHSCRDLAVAAGHHARDRGDLAGRDALPLATEWLVKSMTTFTSAMSLWNIQQPLTGCQVSCITGRNPCNGPAVRPSATVCERHPDSIRRRYEQ